MSKTIIPTRPDMGRAIIDHDPRNRNFPVSGVLFAEDAPLRDRVWRRGRPYDQGQTSQCVAYTGKGMFNTAPFSAKKPYRVRSKFSCDEFYEGAQNNDEWEGTNYDGTSGRGLLRFLTDRGIIREYRWSFGIDDALRTLSHWGPLSIGSWWKSSMFHPDSRGLVSYSGSNSGGHQWQAIGIDTKREEIIAMNSWGSGWGVNGRFRMKFSEFETLLNEDADAHTYVEV